jgi:hypothetical protein
MNQKEANMKLRSIIFIVLLLSVRAQDVHTTNAIVSSVVLGSEGSAIRIERRVRSRLVPGTSVTETSVSWVPTGTSDIQGLTPLLVLFEIDFTNVVVGRPINSSYPVVQGQMPAQYPPVPEGASNVLGGLLGYTVAIAHSVAGSPIATNFTDRQSLTPALRGLTNAYFAFRQLQADGFHYGWYQVQRSAPNGYVPWYLVNAAVHPVPDEPIQAGLPPPQPVIEAHVTAAIAPETDASVRLTWPNAYRNYRLERASALEAPILWEPVDLVGTNQVSIPLGGSNLFYRLSPP